METLHISLWVVVVLVLVALAFDFMNGFHDAANSIATVVSTRVLKPQQAVLMAAFFNFAALFIFHFKVATTIGSGIIDQGIVDHYVIFGALVGAITWNIITWYYGIPSSSMVVISWWIWSRSIGVMKVLCSSAMVSCVILSAARSAWSMPSARASRSLNSVIIRSSSRLPMTICSAWALNSSKKLPSRGIRRENMWGDL